MERMPCIVAKTDLVMTSQEVIIKIASDEVVSFIAFVKLVASVNCFSR